MPIWSAGLGASCKGIDRLLMMPTSEFRQDARKRHQADAVAAAASAGVKHVIYISIIGARPGPGVFDAHFATEQTLIASGLDWTLVRMSLYVENLIGSLKHAVASGVYAKPSGVPAAHVVRDDIARLAAVILMRSGHENMTYHATGPTSVTPAEVADALARAVGKTMKAVEVTDEEYRQGLVGAGLPAGVVDIAMRYEEAIRRGAFDLVSGDIGHLTGKKAESVLEFFTRNKALLTSA